MKTFSNFIKEELTKEKHHVVIYNRGGYGGQALWPSTDKPKAMSHGRAIKHVVDHESNRMWGITPTAAHVKPLSVAHHYVTGKALESIKKLQQHHGVEPVQDEPSIEEKDKLFNKDFKAKQKILKKARA